jgi:hypothetical protein
MDHLYIRLAWAYLEPVEGRFNWKVIDDLITKWTAHGMGIAFRISCKETSTDRTEQQYATPKWVMDAGARGGYYRTGKEAGPDAPWEPVFDDPVFLAKLENFLRAFAERYDGKLWIRYIDIGSIGDWGEGHTWAGSRKDYGFDIRKRHVDLHLQYFKRSQLTISDDFVFAVGDTALRQRLHEHVIKSKISYRDDSILVDGYFAGHSATATVRSPEFFADSAPLGPNVLELEHYGAVKKAGNWTAREGSSIAKYGGGKTGPDMLREALSRLHATYIGYHGYVAEWLNDNPELTVELLNRCGYWYFLHNARTPDERLNGRENELGLTWENRGAAPAYNDFQLILRLRGEREVKLPDLAARNRRWGQDGTTRLYNETYQVVVPSDVSPGTYSLALKLRSPDANRDVLLPFKRERRDPAGFYETGSIRVRSP